MKYTSILLLILPNERERYRVKLHNIYIINDKINTLPNYKLIN